MAETSLNLQSLMDTPDIFTGMFGILNRIGPITDKEKLRSSLKDLSTIRMNPPYLSSGIMSTGLWTAGAFISDLRKAKHYSSGELDDDFI